MSAPYGKPWIRPWQLKQNNRCFTPSMLFLVKYYQLYIVQFSNHYSQTRRSAPQYQRPLGLQALCCIASSGMSWYWSIPVRSSRSLPTTMRTNEKNKSESVGDSEGGLTGRSLLPVRLLRLGTGREITRTRASLAATLAIR